MLLDSYSQEPVCYLTRPMNLCYYQCLTSSNDSIMIQKSNYLLIKFNSQCSTFFQILIFYNSQFICHESCQLTIVTNNGIIMILKMLIHNSIIIDPDPGPNNQNLTLTLPEANPVPNNEY